MRKLGEQWVEELDGKKHMLKAVNYSEGCNGCIFLRYDPDEFYTCNRGRLGCPVDDGMIIKDLGILNEDGCLPCPWGGYPKIIHEVDQDRTESGEDVHYDNLWCVEIHKPVLICTDEYPTKQQAIDAWNMRA